MKIGVIGLGLIGGSIFKTLNDLKTHKTIGISSSVKESGVTNDYNALKNCDIIFVCTPMNATLEILDKLDSILPNTAIVTDVCSLKTFVSKKRYSYKFIPSHPMAGTENSGWESSFSGLFNGAKWVITPLDNTLSKEQKLLTSIIESMGAKVIITTPEEHDKAVSLISNLPLIIAQALCLNIKDNKLVQALASSGFKDATRLALSNTQMACDMLNLNRENILESLESLNSNLKNLIDKNYEQNSTEIKEFRKNLY